MSWKCQRVTLSKNQFIVDIDRIDTYGVYFVSVVDDNDIDYGTKAIFHMVANKKGGTCHKTTSVDGRYGENVAVIWDKSQVHPRLKYDRFPVGAENITQTFKICFRKDA